MPGVANLSPSDSRGYPMRRCLAGLILAISLTSVKADMGPPQPAPPPPDGPDKATIRGVDIVQSYTYWMGRRWMTIVSGCAAGQPACKGMDLFQCFVAGLDGQSVGGGDIARLLALEKSAGASPIKLMLEHCKVSELELGR
jgi:hypothetical protein